MFPDDTGRVPPPRASSSTATTSTPPSPRRVSRQHVDAHTREKPRRHGSPSPLEARSALPYLHYDTPIRKGPPARLDLGHGTSTSADPSTVLGSLSVRRPAPEVIGGLRTGGLERPLGSSGIRRRPSPLELGRTKAVGVDEELAEQRGFEGPLTAVSVVEPDSPDSLNNEMHDLSILRDSVRRNLLERPVDSPLGGSDSGGSTGGLTPDYINRPATLADDETMTIEDALELLYSSSGSSQVLFLDTRPLGEFLGSHLPRSANVSIPSLIFKRFRKASAGKATSWDSLGSFVSTPAGKDVWEGIDPTERVDVVVLGLTAADEPARVLRGIVQGIVTGQVKVLRGGWAAVLASPRAKAVLVAGEESVARSRTAASTSLSTSSPAPEGDGGFHRPAPPIPPLKAPLRVTHHPSMPSLRPTSPQGGKRNVPSLSVQTGGPSTRRPPKLSLNLDKPLRSATSGSFQDEPLPTSNAFASSSNTLAVPEPRTHASGSRSPRSATSLQALCHQQSKLPPSPSSFGVRSHVDDEEDLISPPTYSSPSTPWAAASTARPGGSLHLPVTPHAFASGSATARNGIAPFIVSTILPSFLYLGPEITSTEEVDALVKMGVKRILNVAIECADDKQLRMSERFERYHKIPMRDIVEESGVAKGMEDACKFLDDARLHSAPTYVHCKAGKSRSVTVVLAYLIHANAWTLKTSYAYVAERRKGISPNIGFVAELMQFEEAELGLKQSGGVHGDGSGRKSGGGHREEDDDQAGKGQKGSQRPNPRHMRESLPPAWAASLDSGQPKRVPIHSEEEDPAEEESGRKAMGDEREVRKNGQWVHHRRAPVDRTTLQPGRRVSKAGLESLRPLAVDDSSSKPGGKPSPRPSPRLMDGGDKPSTPGGEGRIGWV